MSYIGKYKDVFPYVCACKVTLAILVNWLLFDKPNIIPFNYRCLARELLSLKLLLQSGCSQTCGLSPV
jgi:hypothetical protein